MNELAQSSISDLVKKKANKFTFDELITMLGRAGKKIEFPTDV